MKLTECAFVYNASDSIIFRKRKKSPEHLDTGAGYEENEILMIKTKLLFY